jgi:hypothetical protein
VGGNARNRTGPPRRAWVPHLVIPLGPTWKKGVKMGSLPLGLAWRLAWRLALGLVVWLVVPLSGGLLRVFCGLV